MTSVFVQLCACLLLTCLSRLTASQSPPKILQSGEEVRKVIPAGTNIQLPCSVEGALFFDWLKNQEPISGFAPERIRISQAGALKIRSAAPEDTGKYVCRAVNGFGSVDLPVTLLIVLDDIDYDDSENTEQSGNHYPEDGGTGDSKTPRKKPEFVHVTRFHQSSIQRPVGSSIRLKCEATGHPRPQITWLKDSQPFTSLDWTSSTPKKARWSVHLQNMQVVDSGHYMCLVHNALGSINATFVIEVVDSVRKKPELTGVNPVNTTVETGEGTTMECQVVSNVPPLIQWLKKVGTDDVSDENLMRVHGEYFRVLKSSEVAESKAGSFINKLQLTDVQLADAGKYVCLAANTEGYTFRSAFLNVVPKSKSKRRDDSTAIPFPITVATTVTVIGVLVVLVALVYHCRSRRRRHVPESETKRPYLGLPDRKECRLYPVDAARYPTRPQTASSMCL